jgi:hypothetical protein
MFIMEAKEVKSFRLSKEHLEYINKFQSTLARGEDIPATFKLEEILDTMSAMLEFSESEIKGILTVAEASLICDMLNSSLYSTRIHPTQYLVMQVQDSDFYESLGAKWDVDCAALAEKLSKLSSLQAYVIISKACKFWETPPEVVTRNGLEKVVSKIFSIGS